MQSGHRTFRIKYKNKSSGSYGMGKKRKPGRWLLAVTILLILAAAVMAFFNYLNNTDLLVREDTLSVELGSELIINPSEWIEASSSVISQTEIDTSDVDVSKPGKYMINLRFKQRTGQITVHVQDTTSPVGTPVENAIVSANTNLSAESMIKDITDYSDVTASFDQQGIVLEKQFTEPGKLIIAVYLTDAAGNQKKYDIELVVAPPDTTAPVITGVSDLSIEFGEPFEPLRDVSAYDNTDGSLNSQIKWTGDFDTKSVGEYQIDYTVTDSSGNIADAHRVLTVKDPFVDLKNSNKVIIEGGPENYRVLNRVLEYLGDNTGKTGIVYENLLTGDGFSINADRQFRSASTAKLFVNMAMYELVEQGKADLTEIMHYTDTDYEGGTGILQGMDLKAGYTLGTLADYAMLHSDNIAFKMIRRYVGRAETFDYYESIIGHPTDRNMTSMSAADGASLIRHLYTSDFATFDHMMENMLHTDFNDMLPKYLPDGLTAHKVGFYSSFYHDVGIVYDGDNPYIISIFSDNLPNAQESIAQISKIIFDQRK